jgi:chromosome partitioning protein
MIISISSHKGGVGKTTIAVVLPFYLRSHFKNILLIDFDPQANLTRRIAGQISQDKNIKNIFEFLLNNDTKQENTLLQLNELFKMANIYMYINQEFGVNLLGSELGLSSTMKKMYDESSVMIFRITDFINHIKKQFDLIVIDTPPSTGLLTFAAIAASDYYILPITSDVDAITGAINITNMIIPNIKNYFNPKIKSLGTLVNMSESRTNVDKVTMDRIEHAFGNTLFKTKISRTTKIREVNLSFEATIANLKNSKVEREFIKLADEIMERIYGQKETTF